MGVTPLFFQGAAAPDALRRPACGAGRPDRNNNTKQGIRMNPLTSVKGSLLVGFALAVLIAGLIGGFAFNELSLARWLHIIAGVFWIGLLYYFNAVQTPAMAVAAADKGGPGGAGVNKYVAPLALLWFRWSALATWILGAWLLSQTPGRFVATFTFGLLQTPVIDTNVIMGIGAWLGTIMLFNVWALIWPCQKKLLGIVPATDDAKAAARKVALYASRTNFLLSIPMLMCMIGPSHGLPF
jgi:uncharacterized membrane protein